MKRIFLLALTFIVLPGIMLCGNRKLWERYYGGKENDGAAALLRVNSNCIVVGWITDEITKDLDGYILNLDSIGNIAWASKAGGPAEDYFWSACISQDQQFVVCGTTMSRKKDERDVFVVKFDQKGRILWEREYGGLQDERANKIVATKDGGYFMVGSTKSYGNGQMDVYAIKTDSGGTIQWDRCYGGKGDDVAWDCVQIDDGGFIFCGSTNSNDSSNYNLLVVRIDNTGNEVWEKCIGGKMKDEGRGITVTDGGVIVVGGTETNIAKRVDISILKFDFNGKLLWSYAYGGKNDDWGNKIISVNREGYIVTGAYSPDSIGYSKLCIMKIDKNGNEEWHELVGGISHDWGNDLVYINNGECILAGITNSYGHGLSDIYVVKYNIK